MTWKTALIIFIASLVVRLGYLGIIYTGQDALAHGDSTMYLQLSNWLTSLIEGRIPEHDLTQVFQERSPGYIYFLSAFQLLGLDHTIYPVLSQILIDAFVCVIIGWIASFFSSRLVLLTGLIAALNFNMVIHASLILSDTLFMLPFVGGLATSAAYIRSPSSSMAGITALLFACSVLIRPILLYFPPILFLFFLFVAWRKNITLKRLSLHLTLISLVFTVLLGPTLFNNLEKYGYFAYTSQTGTHALYWIFPQANEYANGVPIEDSIAEMRSRLAEYQKLRNIKSETLDAYESSYHKQHVASAALWELGIVNLTKAWLIGATINLSAPSALNAPPVREMKRPSFSETRGSNPVEKILNYLTSNMVFTSAILPMLIITILARLLVLVGLFRACFRKPIFTPDHNTLYFAKNQTLFLLITSAYTIAVTGPVVGAKYRLPLEPVMDVFLAIGLVWCIDRWRQHHKKIMAESA